MNKTQMVKLVAKYLLYAGAIASIALVISGVFESSYITINWVKCLIGVALLIAIDFTHNWLNPKKCCRKDDAK